MDGKEFLLIIAVIVIAFILYSNSNSSTSSFYGGMPMYNIAPGNYVFNPSDGGYSFTGIGTTRGIGAVCQPGYTSDPVTGVCQPSVSSTTSQMGNTGICPTGYTSDPATGACRSPMQSIQTAGSATNNLSGSGSVSSNTASCPNGYTSSAGGGCKVSAPTSKPLKPVGMLPQCPPGTTFDMNYGRGCVLTNKVCPYPGVYNPINSTCTNPNGSTASLSNLQSPSTSQTPKIGLQGFRK